jgi:hypothetical protein
MDALDGIKDDYEEIQERNKDITLKQQVKSGELDLKDDSGTDDDGGSEGEVPEGKFKYRGKEYTEDDLDEVFRKAANAEKLAGEYTRSRQELSGKDKEGKEKDDAISEVIAGLKKEYAADEALLKVLSVVESLKKENEGLKGAVETTSQESERRRVEEMVDKARRNVERKYDIKLPDIGSGDFNTLADIASNIDPTTARLELAYLLTRGGDKERQEPRDTLRHKEDPDSDRLEGKSVEDSLALAKRWGLPKDMIEKVKSMSK